MSFADAVRDELYEMAVKKNCCRRALAAGLLLVAEQTDGDVIAARLPSQRGAELAQAVFGAQFGRSVAFEQVKLLRGACEVRFSAPSARKLLLRLQEPDGFVRLVGTCEGCRTAFLSGAFLATGTVNDPHRSIHLEFLLRNPASQPILQGALTDCGYPPHITQRANGIGLYYKDGASVEDLLTLCGAGRMAMELMNVRFERQLRGEENRATNCTTRNISKTVSAAVRQLEAIHALRRSGRLDQLSDGVRQTAALREENPEASLEELRLLHEPPITRSGLNHRLERLIQEAEGTKRKG